MAQNLRVLSLVWAAPVKGASGVGRRLARVTVSKGSTKEGGGHIMNIKLRMALPVAMLAIMTPLPSNAQDTQAHSKDVEAKIAYCKKCHGQNGAGLAAAYSVPRLAGQTIPYLEAKFGIISEHKRDNTTAETFMVPVLGSVDPAIRKAVATYFNGLEPPPAGGGSKDLIPEGQKIFEEGAPATGVPACKSCHGSEAKGKDLTPRLAGQIYPYTVKVLTNWTIINKEQDGVKAPVQHQLTEAQIAAVSSYLSNLR
jgi:cytochrome c553